MQLKRINDFSSLTERSNTVIFGNINSEDNHDYEGSSISRIPASKVDREVRERVSYLDINFRNRLIVMIYHEDFYPGETNETISFVGTLRRYSDVALVSWFTKLYADYIHTPPVLLGLLHIILYYNDVFREMLITTAHAAVSNESCEVQELGIRMLESKCCEEHLEALRSLKKQDAWLQNYIDRVKKDFEKQLCRY